MLANMLVINFFFCGHLLLFSLTQTTLKVYSDVQQMLEIASAEMEVCMRVSLLLCTTVLLLLLCSNLCCCCWGSTKSSNIEVS